MIVAPRHAYGRGGAYAFSFSVHDSLTGLDHTLGATTLHAWSTVPTLLGDQSSRSIHATVDSTWSGVVAEFGYEAPWVTPTYPYEAQIDWGDGEPPTQGTIGVQSAGTLTVSGSFTYPRAFSGTVSVMLAFAGRPLATWTTSSVTAQSTTPAIPAHARRRQRAKFGLVGKPILAETRGRRGRTESELVLHLDNPLPKTRSGHIEATLKAGELTSGVRAFDAHTGHYCYASSAAGLADRAPRPGRGYLVTVSIGSPLIERINTTASARRFASRAAMLAAVRRQLGC